MTVPDEHRPMRVALVSCGKAKLDHPAPARDLYTGSLFRAAKKGIAAAGYDAWWILSARHHLVHPDEIISPYDAAIDGWNLDQLHVWRNRVDARFRCDNYGAWTQAGGKLEVDIYAGKAYVDAVMADGKWERLQSWEIRVPHEGLQIGQRIAAFSAMAA